MNGTILLSDYRSDRTDFNIPITMSIGMTSAEAKYIIASYSDHGAELDIPM